MTSYVTSHGGQMTGGAYFSANLFTVDSRRVVSAL